MGKYRWGLLESAFHLPLAPEIEAVCGGRQLLVETAGGRLMGDDARGGNPAITQFPKGNC